MKIPLYIFFFLISNLSFAQTFEKANGPSNAQIHALAGNGSHLYAATIQSAFFQASNRVYMSDSDGNNWAPIGLGGKFIRSLACIGTNLFAATTEGVYFTNNNGTSWSLKNDTIANFNSRCIAANNNKIYTGTYKGIYLSIDSAKTWTRISTVSNANRIYIDGNNIYVASVSGLHYSFDHGLTWNQKYAGVFIHDVIASDSNIYISRDANGSTFSYSYDKGFTWTHVSENIIGDINNFAILGSKLYAFAGAHILISSDNGINWDEIPNRSGISSVVVNNSKLYIGTSGGIKIVGTSTSFFSNAGLYENIETYCFAKGTGSRIYSGTSNQLYISEDNSYEWESYHNFYIDASNNTKISDIATKDQNVYLATSRGLYQINENNPDYPNLIFNYFNSPITTVYVSDGRIFIYYSQGFFYSDNDGSTWTQINGVFGVRKITKTGSYLFAGTNTGVRRSSDNGLTWTAVNLGLTRGDIYSIVAKDSIIVVGAYGFGVFVSTNYGDLWTESNNGLQINAQSYFPVYFSGNKLLAGVIGGVYYSENYGGNWKPLAMGIRNNNNDPYAVFSLYADDRTIFAGTNGLSTWKTRIPTFLSGTVSTYSNLNVASSKVYFLEIDSLNNSVRTLDSTVTNSSGSYSINIRKPFGYIKAVPNLALYPNEELGYCDSAMVIQNAKIIDFDVDSILRNIKTHTKVPITGTGEIKGKFFSDENDNISNLRILLLDVNNKIIKSVAVNCDSFTFSNLSEGVYKVWVDKPNINNSIAPQLELTTLEPIKDNLTFVLFTNHLELINNAIITTNLISSVTLSTAECGGNISNDGGSSIIERGVCWSTSPIPITTDSKTSNGNGTGSFTSSLTDLSPNTTYYVRAYAINIAGISYGSEVSFTTPIGTGLINSSQKNNITIYPNPNNGILNININSLNSENFTIRILNINSVVILQRRINNFNGNYNEAFDLGSFTKGIYFIQIVTNTEILIDKFIFE